jgi:glycosyltransferase involved in cell wall biosynthesis
MPIELLSICVPTRNRARYLREILAAFAQQVVAGKLGPDQVKFYISDNAAEDETPEIIREFGRKVPWSACSRNPVNIGGDANIAHVRSLGKGEYIWVVGDDEILAEGAVLAVLKLIQEHRPGLIIAYDTGYNLKIPRPQVFADYRAFAKECIRYNTHALAEQTLISSNVFRADCFDSDYAQANLHTNFGHMFGLIRPVAAKKVSVLLPEAPIITVRKWRPGGVDGEWPDLDVAWLRYLQWLREELQLPELDPHAPIAEARQNMIRSMTRNPVRFLTTNWRSIFDPKAYRFVGKRLLGRKP